MASDIMKRDNSMPPIQTHKKQKGRIPQNAQAHIGKQLRTYYDAVASEPVPDKFLELLNQLDKENSSEAGKE
jgi:hypothetical protein